jgi:hypothetical protein
MAQHYLWFALVFILFAGCENPWRNKPYTIKDGHERMVAILDSIARFADPETHANLSGKNAELLKKQLKKLPNDELTEARTRYAEELLRAGENGQAVLELASLTRELGDSILPDHKRVFELLALAHFRTGELENCVEAHNDAACTLPIGPKGTYTDMIGIENAIKTYRRLLRSFPHDAQNRWMLQLCQWHKGLPSDSLPAAWHVPTKTLEPAPDAPTFTNRAAALGIAATGLGGSICLDDFDHDGDLDVFMVRQGLRDQCRYFVQEQGRFLERTSDARLEGLVGGHTIVQADYDNDGDADILIVRGGGLVGGAHPNSLLRNNGNNTFTDVTIEAGLLSFKPSAAADWADYDGDGWLDLYVANESPDSSRVHPNELYHNNGNGTFTNVATTAGVDFVGMYKAAIWGDANNDRRPDLYLVFYGGSNKLLMNRGSNNNGQWQFQDIAARAGVLGPKHCTVAGFADMDNDGWDDILALSNDLTAQDSAGGEAMKVILGQKTAQNGLKLYHNNGNETFTEQTLANGAQRQYFAQSLQIGDFDNNGWPDIFIGTGAPSLFALLPNVLLLNQNGKTFTDASMNGAGHLQKTKGIALGDMDNDGDTDILATTGGLYDGDVANVAYFENRDSSHHHWLQLDLRGSVANRDAKGARVAVTVLENGKKRTIRANCSTGTNSGGNSRRVGIGLGKAQKIEKLEIFWPHFSGASTVVDSVVVDSRVFVLQK